MVESGRVLGKGGIGASTEKLSRRVPEKGRNSVSTEKWYNSGDYSEKVESVQEPTNISDEYLKNVELVSVTGNSRIRATTWKR